MARIRLLALPWQKLCRNIYYALSDYPFYSYHFGDLLHALVCLHVGGIFAETVIQKRFVEYLGVNVEKSDIVKTPYSGLYEVRVGNNLVYTDAEARYLFIGNIMDIQTRTDYTNEKLRKFAITDFSSLPKDLAIRIVKGSGEGKMAVFRSDLPPLQTARIQPAKRGQCHDLSVSAQYPVVIIRRDFQKRLVFPQPGTGMARLDDQRQNACESRQ